MATKGVIIGTFVKKNKVLSFIESLRNLFGVKSDKIFVYSIDTNKYEYLVTFKAYDKNAYVNRMKGSTVMHVKNGCIFSINALNKLIESEIGDKSTPCNEYELDWSNYKDKLIILTNGELTVSNLTKIDDKSVFFNY